MTKSTSTRSTTTRNAAVAATIRFSTTLLSPRRDETSTGRAGSWSFLVLPKAASAKLPSRGQVAVEGTLNGAAFRAVLEPDGAGGHWLKVEKKLRDTANAAAGESVSLELTPSVEEPEPKVPPELRTALAAAPAKAREVWKDITPAARQDFIHWITSAKQEVTRARRIITACDMLAKGKRRPCCFDRSGMYSKSLSCPVAE